MSHCLLARAGLAVLSPSHEVFCVNRFYVQVTFGLKLGILDTTMIALRAIVDYNYRKITKCSAENLILQTNH